MILKQVMSGTELTGMGSLEEMLFRAAGEDITGNGQTSEGCGEVEAEAEATSLVLQERR